MGRALSVIAIKPGLMSLTKQVLDDKVPVLIPSRSDRAPSFGSNSSPYDHFVHPVAPQDAASLQRRDDAGRG